MSTDSFEPRRTTRGASVKNPGDAILKLGYIAWIVYGRLAGNGYWLSAGLVGVGLISAVVATEYRRRAIKIMDCTSLSYFGAEALTVMLGGAAFIQRYHQILVWGLFAIVAWLTLAAGAPFTLQYTRRKTPPVAWDDVVFYRMNRHMTIVWSAVFTLGTILGEAIKMYGHPRLFGLIVPMAAMGLGLVFSQLYPRRYAARFALANQAAPSAPSPHDEPVARLRLT